MKSSSFRISRYIYIRKSSLEPVNISPGKGRGFRWFYDFRYYQYLICAIFTCLAVKHTLISQNSLQELLQALNYPLPSRLKLLRGEGTWSLAGNVPQTEGELGGWHTCVSNMYIHNCVRLAEADEMAPDAKEADRGALCLKARPWDICYSRLHSFYKCSPHSRGYRWKAVFQTRLYFLRRYVLLTFLP